MGIFYDGKNQIFHLQSKDTSYVIKVLKQGYLAHVYWGKKVRGGDLSGVLAYVGRVSFSAQNDKQDSALSLDTLTQEYPAYGNTDLRDPAYQFQLEDGSTITDLRYQSHRIYKGKPMPEGLPAVYAENENECETLEIDLYDSLIGLKATLYYTVFEDFSVIARSVKFTNRGTQKLKLLRALSASVDFARSDFDFLSLSGSWARERYIERAPLRRGKQSIESRRGASGHEHNPFFALLDRGANEDFGEVFGFSLIYSGNFLAQAELDQYGVTRAALGLNPFDFSWLLEPGESFQTPEAVLVYSQEGLGGMSRTFHRLYRTRLCRGKYRDALRPILINNWEATYFDFNEEILQNIAKTAAGLGIELFVLDDGWFGKRNNDTSSLGDWFENREKLPGGLARLIAKINETGLKFGLWVEPEMVSPDSDLYRAHPDWCLHVEGRSRSEARHQLILDLSRSEVCDYIIKTMSSLLSRLPISYVKWDMNRNMTEIGSSALPPERQRETAHRYMLGLYRVMEKVTSSFPDVLFESCSGGGGRFDPGILYYMPQTWTSDNTDAVSRLKIQYGTSLVYPASAMGAHVSAVPNHQTHRVTPLETRGYVAMSGNLGYELDVSKLTDAEKELIKKQIKFYKEVEHLVMFGDFYRILSPFEDNAAAWIFVSCDKREAFACYVNVLAEANPPLKKLRLKGLDPDLDYRISDRVHGGDVLMNIGINLPIMYGDYRSIAWHLKAE